MYSFPQKLLSGEQFQTLCDISWINDQKRSFHTSLSSLPSLRLSMFDEINNVNEGNVIFVYTDLLDDFIKTILPYRIKPFVLVTHNSDDSITEKHIELLNNSLLLHMYSQNTYIDHPKLTALPIGIANSMWYHGSINNFQTIIQESPSFDNKKKCIYSNVNRFTNMNHRSMVLNTIQQFPFVDIVEPKDHMSYLHELSNYKWVFSPKGNGVDCHRLWESLYAKCIPLVDDTVNTRQFREMGLPIILIKDWNTLSLEQLEKESENLPKDYSPLLDLSFWNNKFHTHFQNIDKNTQNCFVFVYIGKLRDYMHNTLKQVRLWNPKTPLYVCISRLDENKPYIDSFKQYNVIIIYLEDLEETSHHKRFHINYTNLSMNNFWKYTMERFFYLEECIKKYELTNIFHHEFDNMIYFKADELTPLCKSRNMIMIPSDSDTRFIAGSCYIPNVESLIPMNEYFANNAKDQNEMEMMMNFYKSHSNTLEGLPIIPPEYPHLLKPNSGNIVSKPQRMYETVSHFKGIFDAAAIGQYFGGIDPIHNRNNTDGYISPDCAFNVNNLQFQWRKINGLYQPWVSADKNHWYPIYNLHIHNKNMERWMSDIFEIKAHLYNIQVL